MAITLLGSIGATSFTWDSGTRSPVNCTWPNGWPVIAEMNSSPGPPSTTPNETPSPVENLAIRT